MFKIKFLASKLLKNIIKTVLLIAALAVGMVNALEIPHLILLLYIVSSILFGFTRRKTALAAALCLILTPVALLLDWKEMARSLAVYSYLLFIVALLIEIRFVAHAALAILILTPVALILGLNSMAENMAIFTYFLLMLTVIIELQRSKQKI